MKNQLRSLSSKISVLAGSAWAFMLALLGIVVWAVTGPYYHFSNTWLVTIGSITDVIIFLMVFSLQYTQNRDSKAIQLKLNELIVADKKASDAFIGLETLTDEELGQLDGEFKEMLDAVTAKPVLHKLHKKIVEEKSNRSGKQSGKLVDALIGSFAVNKDKK
jgi:low affinity Fe/Cu permease